MLKPYQENIHTIKNEIYEMGQEIIHANKVSLSALKENDMTMLKDVNLSIKKLSKRSNEIDNLIVKTLALYSPEARDLREMVSYLKITNELIRAGANAKEFIKTFKKYFSEDLDQAIILEYAIPLIKSSNKALETTVALIKESDDKIIEDGYKQVIVEESKTDDLYSMLEKNILKLVTKNLDLSKEYFDILTSLRKLAKTSDRAVSIAHLVMYAELGGEL